MRSMGKTSACAKPEGGGHLVVQVRQRNADLVDRLCELHFVKHFIKIGLYAYLADHCDCLGLCVSCCVVNHIIRIVIFALISDANLTDVMNQTKRVGSKAQKLQQVKP